MNPSIKKLAHLAEKESRLIIGLMSGTSLDGLDIALCEIAGSGRLTEVSLVKFITKSYSGPVKDSLRNITSVEQVSLKDLCYLHTWLGQYHAKLVSEALGEWEIRPETVDCIASHGQTIYHLPGRDPNSIDTPVNSTLQIADGDHIAVQTGILTISDFRQKHTATGGEGAPMAPLVDEWLFTDSKENRILLNIGGIANYTFLPADNRTGFQRFSTDTGPGNTLIDAAMEWKFDKPYDNNGQIAAAGTVIKPLLDAMLADRWFADENQKSTGPEYFNLSWVESVMKQTGLKRSGIEGKDLVATLTELSAVTISDNIKKHVRTDFPTVIYPSGGGAHNRHLMERIRLQLGYSEFRQFSDLGFSPDAKEAVIFAILANEMIAGSGFNFATGAGAEQNFHFGKISFPD